MDTRYATRGLVNFRPGHGVLTDTETSSFETMLSMYMIGNQLEVSTQCTLQ